MDIKKTMAGLMAALLTGAQPAVLAYGRAGSGSGGIRGANAGKYCRAISATPVLNTGDFSSVFGGSDGNSVKVDGSGLMRELEFIALPGTVFIIDGRLPANGHEIMRVRTRDYPYGGRLYIDSRFVDFYREAPMDRKKKMPAKSSIITMMLEMEGSPYLWGGNYYAGTDKMLEHYPPAGEPGKEARRLWRLEGVDCSGMLYQSTDGNTPRNTSSLVRFGEPVAIRGLCAGRISELVEPLDIIVWKGHVVVVLDSETAIESAYGRGVARSGLRERLESIMREREPADEWGLSDGKSFVLRRWHPQSEAADRTINMPGLYPRAGGNTFQVHESGI